MESKGKIGCVKKAFLQGLEILRFVQGLARNACCLIISMVTLNSSGVRGSVAVRASLTRKNFLSLLMEIKA